MKRVMFSQPHKHMQLIPVPMEGTTTGLNFPMEAKLNAASGNLDPGVIFETGLPFSHLCSKVSSDMTHHQVASIYERMFSRLDLASDVKTAKNPSYNLLLTKKYMFMVPRRAEKAFGISLNSMVFAGTILVKTEEEKKSVEKEGPLAFMKAVTWGQ
eukprot:TRINITY_DN3570_c0_g1_i1.p1 TRINITY_DN3570_c0_g1~~TRINITY_DN3570_c0_g1_i1.p1  ORF type:complete len:156 (-),score=34.89 TRINITY_DN3570_c0_g1_i1:65-532(-)